MLIVEDQRLNRMLLKKLVDALLPSATVYEAVDGVEGVELFERHAPDIVFMDLQMPRKDGFHAATEIRTLEADGRRTLIIALTADAQPETRESCLESGMDDYLTKPVSIHDLRRVLEHGAMRTEE
ncbi:MAG TPA: response regulator [Synergistales bacterium]|nr:response regulator [Synergistales bacterium]